MQIDTARITNCALDTSRPTRVRYGVVAIAAFLAMITYMDRACISSLATNIMHDLSLSKKQMAFVFSAFALAYGLFEIPTAWWADRVGTRKVLARIVLWWSVFTMATGAASGFVSLVVTRLLFGAGEAGAWPGAARTFSKWIPRNERGTVQGVFFAGAHLAGGFTPLLVMALLNWVSWRMVFFLFGLLGFVWVAVWYTWFRDEPADHPGVNRAELEKIVANRQLDSGHAARWDYWARLFRNRNMQALGVMYFPNSYAFYFCITWLPTYLNDKHGLSGAWLAFWAGMPLVCCLFGDLIGGVATDYVTARFGLRVGRAGVGGLAYIVAGLAMILATFAHGPFLAAGLISLSVGASMFMLGAAWGTCIDIAGNHAGVVSAVMNTSGQVGSILSPIVLIYLVERFDSWNAPLFLMGVLYLVGAAAWYLIDPRKRIFS